MSAPDEREPSPFEFLKNDQRRVDELLSRMAQVMEKIAQKRLEFRTTARAGTHTSSELEARSTPSR